MECLNIGLATQVMRQWLANGPVSSSFKATPLKNIEQLFCINQHSTLTSNLKCFRKACMITKHYSWSFWLCSNKSLELRSIESPVPPHSLERPLRVPCCRGILKSRALPLTSPPPFWASALFRTTNLPIRTTTRRFRTITVIFRTITPDFAQ